MTDGGVGAPIPSVTDDGWGVSQDPSVSVIRPRRRPLWFFGYRSIHFSHFSFFWVPLQHWLLRENSMADKAKPAAPAAAAAPEEPAVSTISDRLLITEAVALC
jgi:hypothetical protein